jgi:hypothetical protein
MKKGTVNIYLMVIGFTGITQVFCVEILANPDSSDSENEEHNK